MTKFLHELKMLIGIIVLGVKITLKHEFIDDSYILEEMAELTGGGYY